MIDITLEMMIKSGAQYACMGFGISFVVSMIVWSIFSVIKFFDRTTRP